MRNILAKSMMMKKGLDDDYTLFDDGEILHEYDANHYPSGMNRSRKLRAEELSSDVKNRLLEAASTANRQLVKEILGLNEA
ncbi:hypothetical protein [Flavobacterium sp. MK4S-17]|uniref:hypothetical protein n=1 Tax=Flavobacterium sp. MK4S-17 TaxID=2543737 RepID=UPI00135B8669|nr:hypothetical protein [Flavobacterium sp. MK4S-17]